MARLILFIAAFWINFAVFADSNEKLNYYSGSYADALKEAKRQNKLVFIDAYTDWCGWCKKLDRTTFKDTSVIRYMNDYFIVLKLDMENGEGPSIGAKYNVNSFPTLLFLNQDGKEVVRIEGFVNSDEFLSYAKKASKKN